jgi:hypothetical protein
MKLRLDLPNPDEELVLAMISQFEKENEADESGLTQLLAHFPGNTDRGQVAIKVVAINALYNTQLRYLRTVAQFICDAQIDAQLATGSSDAVNLIEKVPCDNGKTRWNYSFATKYCSWHRPDCYPIYDSRVDYCLRSYALMSHFEDFKQDALWDYKAFRDIVDSFRTHYHLEKFTYKKLDMFLYQLGDRYFNETETPHA